MTSETHSESAELAPALLELEADIVAAYVSRNAVPAAELPTFNAQIYSNIAQIANGPTTSIVEPPIAPAVSIKASVTGDHLVYLEDGLKFQSLKRHLAASHALTPQEYREKWGLPAVYPMVAPAFAATRSKLAKDLGLGRKADASMAPAKKPASKKAPRPAP